MELDGRIVSTFGRAGKLLSRGLQATRSALLTVVIAAVLWPAGETSAGGPLDALQVVDLTGRRVAPFTVSGARPIVFVFATMDCPISNRYAPELQRLGREFEPDVAFWLVYPDSSLSPAGIQQHVKEFSYSFPVLRDTEHALVRLTGATVMPEVAVFDRSQRLVYRGRIDDRVVTFGTIRAEPTKRDLQEVLTALGAGIAMSPTTTQAVGCYIPE
jgi:redoxin